MENIIKMIQDFHVWLMTEPYPESVRDVQRYWVQKRKEYADKAIEKYNKEIKEEN